MAAKHWCAQLPAHSPRMGTLAVQTSSPQHPRATSGHVALSDTEHDSAP